MSFKPLEAAWPGRVRAHLALARVSNSPTVATNVLAGAALGGSVLGGGVLDGKVLLLALSMVLFYTAGMYLNDVLDLGIDRRERPERPLPSGAVSLGEALSVTLLLFAVGAALLWPLGRPALFSGLALIALIALYDAWHKTNPLSPVLMAGTRALVYVTAFVAYALPLSGPLLVWAALLGGYIVGLTYLAKTENAPGLARYWPAALLFLPAVYALLGAFSLGTLALALAYVAWAAYSVSFVYDLRRRSVGRAIGFLIAGVSLLDALVLAATGAWGWLPLALLGFLLTLSLQRHIKGT